MPNNQNNAEETPFKTMQEGKQTVLIYKKSLLALQKPIAKQPQLEFKAIQMEINGTNVRK